MTRELLRESNIRDLHETINYARRQWNRENGNCTMCASGDRPHGGLHRGQWPCGNRITCQVCHGVLPLGEQCRACNRITQTLKPTIDMMKAAGISRMSCSHGKDFVLQMESGEVITLEPKP